MADVSGIREHMEVRDAAGVTVGTVDHVEGDQIKLTRSHAVDGQHHYIPLSAVDHVDAHVHLNASAAVLGLAPVSGSASASVAPGAAAAPDRKSVLPWILAAVGLILLLLLFRSCVHQKEADTTAAPTTVAQTAGAAQSTALAGLGAYLGGTEATPRTFTFDKLHFDTAKSAVRAEDQAEIAQVATVLKQYDRARIRVAGYADARGAEPANIKLGQDRAEAVKAALVKQGIDGGRIDTATGGTSDPVDTNTTTQGQAENRRTELVVVSR